MAAKVIFLIYGIFLLVGAFMGLKAGSKISLIAGLASATFVFAGIILLGSNAKLGYGILTGTSGLLTIVFLIRFIKTGAFMPSGMILAFSIVMLVIGFIQLIQR